MRALLLAPVLLALAASASCGGDTEKTGEAGSGGSGGAGGSGGGSACVGQIRVGTVADPEGDDEHFASVTAGQELEVFLPDPGSQSASGHIWTGLLVHDGAFDSSGPLFVTLQILFEDGTKYSETKSCIPKLRDYAKLEAGWWSLPTLRATFPEDGAPRTDLPGHTLTVRALVDDGVTSDCAPAREAVSCSGSGEMVIVPVLPPEK